MSLWRKEAFERFPEFRKELQEEKLIHCFLHFLHARLLDAYEEENFEQIERIRDYVFTLLTASPGPDASSDLGTIVSVSFFEHLPESELVRKDIGRWFTKTEIEAMKDIFTYHGTEAQYEEMLTAAQQFKTHKVHPGGRHRRSADPQPPTGYDRQ